MSTNDGVPVNLVLADCEDYERRIAELEAENERLKAMIPTKPEGAERLIWLIKPTVRKPFAIEEDAPELGVRIAELEAKVEQLRKVGADAAGDAVVSHKACERLKEEVERLEAENKRLGTIALTDWKQARDARREANEYCGIVTKLGRRLGRLKKRRKRELAEYKQSQHIPGTARTYCSYCFKFIGRLTAFSHDHWRSCPKHPAYLEVKRLKIELAKFAELRGIMEEASLNGCFDDYHFARLQSWKGRENRLGENR